VKALELTVYPIWDAGDGVLYADRDDPQHPTRVDFEVYRKRLADAELLCEYFRAVASGAIREDACEFTAADRYGAEAITLRRFATLPHYDEKEMNA
jgi:hypothetical protein